MLKEGVRSNADGSCTMRLHQLKFVLQSLAVIGLSVNNTIAFSPSVRPDITTALRSRII